MAKLIAGLGIVALATLGGLIYQARVRARRRAAREEEVTRWEGEGGALADAPAAPSAPQPEPVG